MPHPVVTAAACGAALVVWAPAALILHGVPFGANTRLSLVSIGGDSSGKRIGDLPYLAQAVRWTAPDGTARDVRITPFAAHTLTDVRGEFDGIWHVRLARTTARLWVRIEGAD